MCGIFGAATTRGHALIMTREASEATRDLLAHRGPDASGSFHQGHVALMHRRLAMLDPAGGVQPFSVDARAPGVRRTAESAAGRVTIAWNGEIYNHRELRRALTDDGVVFRTRSDTEVLAWLLALRGIEALRTVRGMYAIAAWFEEDTHNDSSAARERGAGDRLVLARDPFGTIPMYWSRLSCGTATEIVFASEPAPVLSHPWSNVEPDWPCVAAYMEMPRRTFGARTLYRGLSVIEAGEVVTFDLMSAQLDASRSSCAPRDESAPTQDLHGAAWNVRLAVTDAVERHLEADAPVCTLLSGGIDSTIIASIARTQTKQLVTFAAGADVDLRRPGSDLFMARRVAALLGSDHHEIVVDGSEFGARWDALLGDGLQPLATPNEIAISLLGERISPYAKAALSGEGADELFGGYGAPIEATLAWMEADVPHDVAGATRFYRAAFGWSQRSIMSELFAPNVGESLRTCDDDPLQAMLAREFSDAGDLTTLDAHLVVQRRVNLVNLLERLNVSLMRSSVEGRVPFADLRVLESARFAGAEHILPCDDATVMTATRTLMTKRVLREAFADVLSPEIVSRPKASFPLPFEQWIATQSSWIDGPVSREIFSPAARTLVRTQASQHWRMAWPMLNIARWLDTVFA